MKNQIENYFSAFLNGSAYVFKSPVTMRHDLAYTLLSKQLKKSNKPCPQKPFLHVCFDLMTNSVYSPNSHLFIKEEFDALLAAAINKFENNSGIKVNNSVIHGSPFSLLRKRPFESFKYSYEYIANQHPEVKNSIYNIPVVEANLSRMSPTLKYLPAQYQDIYYTPGGYISNKNLEYVDFIEDVSISGVNKKNTLITRQKTPFILLNIAVPDFDHSRKEHVVISAIYDYLLENSTNKNDIEDKSLLAQVKHFLYVGYPFEEICLILLGQSLTITQFLNAGQKLLNVTRDLKVEGYNVTEVPYYISCEIDPKTFSLDIESFMTNGELDPKKQLEFFNIVNYNKENSFVIIETPLFMDPDICQKLLGSKSYMSTTITKYNKAMNVIDVKSSGRMFGNNKRSEQLRKVKEFTISWCSKNNIKTDNIEFRSDNSSRSVSLSTSENFNLRKISEYHFATDKIKWVISDWNKKNPGKTVEFTDITVLVGPIERIMGAGTQGGYMSKKAFELSKLKIPFEITKGIFVSPPLIAINSETKPSYSQQTDTLVHEYCHHLYDLTFNNEEMPEYLKHKDLEKKDYKKWFELYLSDPNERLAHKYQIKHLVESGVTADEIIRTKIGGVVNENNYLQALKFKELVDEALLEN